MRVRLLAAASVELDSAAEWYSVNANRTVAGNFIAAYDTTAQLIADNPGRLPARADCVSAASLMPPSIDCILTTW